MAKLVERELKEWPVTSDRPIRQAKDLSLYVSGLHTISGKTLYLDVFASESDNPMDDVTRTQWEEERARIADEEFMEDPFPDTPEEALERAANRKAAQEVSAIARTGAMTPEEQELMNIACGKRSREDQALCDKVAAIRYSVHLDDIQSTGFYSAEDARSGAAQIAFSEADAFMAERAKRLKGGV